jgi:hypothetical protein
MSPQELADRIRAWASAQGYQYQQEAHATEFAKVIVSDPAGGYTMVVIPNAHHGRRLRRDQVRYTVQRLNGNWRN